MDAPISRSIKGTAGRVRSLGPGDWEQWSSIFVLSPHSDDAALSLAAHTFYLTQAGKEFCLVTCFSTSNFAPCSVTKNPAAITALRKREDARYAAMLGPQCRSVWLEFRDAPLRGYALQDLRHEHEFNSNEDNLVRQIRGRLDSILKPGCVVFVPLGIGSHIDHCVVREVGVSIAQSGQCQTFFYEEMPYAIQENELSIRRKVTALQTRLGGRLTSFCYRKEQVLDIKRAAASCYPSQARPERISQMLGPDTPYVRCRSERVWQFQSKRPLDGTLSLEILNLGKQVH